MEKPPFKNINTYLKGGDFVGSSMGYQVTKVLSNIATYKMSDKRKRAEGIPLENARKKLKQEGRGRQYLYIFTSETMRKYRGICKDFANYCKSEFNIRELKDIKPEMTIEYMNERVDSGDSPYTLKGVYSAIGKLEKGLHHKGWLPKDKTIRPMKNSDFELPKRSLDNRVSYRLSYTNDEAAKVINAVANKNKKIATLLEGQKELGLRISEVKAIKVKDIDIQAGKAHVIRRTKGGKHRHIPIPEKYISKLKSIIQNKGKEDSVYGGPGTSKSNIYRVLRNACQSVDVENRGTHGFRKVFARNQYAKAILKGKGHQQALKEVSLKLGHNRPEITLLYLN